MNWYKNNKFEWKEIINAKYYSNKSNKDLIKDIEKIDSIKKKALLKAKIVILCPWNILLFSFLLFYVSGVSFVVACAIVDSEYSYLAYCLFPLIEIVPVFSTMFYLYPKNYLSVNPNYSVRGVEKCVGKIKVGNVESEIIKYSDGSYCVQKKGDTALANIVIMVFKAIGYQFKAPVIYLKTKKRIIKDDVMANRFAKMKIKTTLETKRSKTAIFFIIFNLITPTLYCLLWLTIFML